jgi:hypothetical protein
LRSAAWLLCGGVAGGERDQEVPVRCDLALQRLKAAHLRLQAVQLIVKVVDLALQAEGHIAGRGRGGAAVREVVELALQAVALAGQAADLVRQAACLIRVRRDQVVDHLPVGIVAHAGRDAVQRADGGRVAVGHLLLLAWCQPLPPTVDLHRIGALSRDRQGRGGAGRDRCWGCGGLGGGRGDGQAGGQQRSRDGGQGELARQRARVNEPGLAGGPAGQGRGRGGRVLVPGSVISHGVDQVTGGGDGQQYRARGVVPVQHPPVLVPGYPDVGAQPQRLQHAEQAVLVQRHNLRLPPAAPGRLVQVIPASVAEVGVAGRRNQRHAPGAVQGQSVL